MQPEIIITKILQMKEFLIGQGIPYGEAERAALAYYNEIEPPVAAPWPSPVTGLDLMPQITDQVFDSGAPPYFQPNTFGTTQPYPTNPTPDPLGAVKTNNPRYDESGSNIGHTYQLQNPPYQGDDANWLGLASDLGSEPPTIGMVPWNVQQDVQPWKYPIEDSQMVPDLPPIAIYPSGQFNETRKIREAIAQVRHEFSWLSEEYLMKAKGLAEGSGGKLYLVRASQEAITDHRAEGEPFRRLLAGSELLAMSRTAIGHGMDINHNPEWRTGATILDSEFDPNTKSIQMLIMEIDPEINQLISNGQIDSVSINGGSPRTEAVEPCNAGCTHESCEKCVVPRGVILGELDGIGLTWVVSDPRGISWRGNMIPKAEPGVKTTIIQPV
jgi:hypothetical protein